MEPKPRHLFSPSHACPNPECRETAAECERLRDIVRRSAIENTQLVEEISGANERDRVQGKEIAHLKRQVTRQANEDAEAEKITRVLENWRKSHPKAQIPAGGKRWDTVKKALRLMKDDEAGPVDACLEALEGLRLMPFVGPHGRTHVGSKGARRFDDVEHALRDEATIERFRGYARQARMSPEERLWRAAEVTGRVHEDWHRLWVERFTGFEGPRS